MRKSIIISVLVLLPALLQGCSQFQNKNGPAKKSQLVALDKPKSNLNQCLQNAIALTKSTDKYKKEVDALYQALNVAKFYASISDNVTPEVSSTVTPLYEYVVKDSCNKISQILIIELRDKIERANTGKGVSL